MTHNLLELLTRVAAGAELEGLSCTGGGGWGGRLCLLGSPAVSAPRGGGVSGPDFDVHTLPPYRLDLFNQNGIQVREEKKILSVF